MGRLVHFAYKFKGKAASSVLICHQESIFLPLPLIAGELQLGQILVFLAWPPVAPRKMICSIAISTLHADCFVNAMPAKQFGFVALNLWPSVCGPSLSLQSGSSLWPNLWLQFVALSLMAVRSSILNATPCVTHLCILRSLQCLLYLSLTQVFIISLFQLTMLKLSFEL